MLGVSIRKMKTLTLKIETVTLISKGTGNDILCITCTKIKVKYFFSADVLFCGGGSSYILINTLTFANMLYLGGIVLDESRLAFG